MKANFLQLAGLMALRTVGNFIVEQDLLVILRDPRFQKIIVIIGL